MQQLAVTPSRQQLVMPQSDACGRTCLPNCESRHAVAAAQASPRQLRGAGAAFAVSPTVALKTAEKGSDHRQDLLPNET